MKCVILAAGYATRLYPLTENFPKPLLTVGDKSIIDRLVDDAYSTGRVDEFMVVTNHRFAGQFREWAARKPMNIGVLDDGTSTNETRLGAVRDIWFALETAGYGNGVTGAHKKTPADDLLVAAGDNVLDFSLAGFLDFAATKGTSCVMCHKESDLLRQRKTAIITKDADDLITSYEEKPRNPRGDLAVPPFYIYRARDAARIPEALAQGCNADAPGSFAAWLSRHTPMHAWTMPGKRYDIGDVESYKFVREVFGK